MAVSKPTNLQPVCQASGCTKGAQMMAIRGSIASWMKTCNRHSYKDLKSTPKIS